MRIVEALEGKGCRLPLMKGEVELAEKLASIVRQVYVCNPIPLPLPLLLPPNTNKRFILKAKLKPFPPA